VKGLEIPGYEPRALQTMALGFAVGTRGADHNRSGAYQVDFSEAVDRQAVGVEGAPLAIETENEATIMDALILCKFLRGVFSDKLAAMAEMLELVTGWNVTADELAETAERIIAAKKWYNIRQGWTPAEDTLPERFLSEALQGGASAGALLSREQLQELIAAYNTARGWSVEGFPREEQLAGCYLGETVVWQGSTAPREGLLPSCSPLKGRN
jgi:aldehyde:ferredoxin oxidoreductase